MEGLLRCKTKNMCTNDHISFMSAAGVRQLSEMDRKLNRKGGTRTPMTAPSSSRTPEMLTGVIKFWGPHEIGDPGSPLSL